MLEYGRTNGTNPQFMLLLMKLYGHLGATECITVLFQSLNIKHLQMDSLGYEKYMYHIQRIALRFVCPMRLPSPSLLPNTHLTIAIIIVTIIIILITVQLFQCS